MVEATAATTSLALPKDADDYHREMRVRAKKTSLFFNRPTTLSNLVTRATFLRDAERILPGAY